MHKKLIFLFFLLGFLSNSIIAQKLEFAGSFIMFREAKTKEPVLIINDSLLYKGVKPIKTPFKHTKYPGKLEEYIPFNIGIKTYLVHDGCGPVLEFRNDSIVRINDAYLQRNQFKAVHFVYKNEIYFYGGYGLFTTKNILTKYIFETKDWVEVQTHGGKVQDPRSGAYSYHKGDTFYVFGGTNKDYNNIPSPKPLDNKVWQLHLPTMKWNCVGNYDQNVINNEIDGVVYEGRNVVKLIKGGSGFNKYRFIELDYYANKINIFERINYLGILSSYIEGDKIMGVYKGEHNSFFYMSDIGEFRGELKSTSVFISPLEPDLNYLAIISVSFLVVISMLYLFRKPLKLFFKPFKGIIYNQQKHSFWYKRKLIISFDEKEKKVLLYLLERLDQYVSLNELNQLFENNTETFSATIKRRELAVNGLLIKVSKITGISEKELTLERKKY